MRRFAQAHTISLGALREGTTPHEPQTPSLAANALLVSAPLIANSHN